jgi:hypothetical protein
VKANYFSNTSSMQMSESGSFAFAMRAGDNHCIVYDGRAVSLKRRSKQIEFCDSRQRAASTEDFRLRMY